MRKRLWIFILATIVLLQAFSSVAFAVSEKEATVSEVSFCNSDTLHGGAGSKVQFGSDTKSTQKLNNQMNQRGWTEGTVRGTVDTPYTTRTSTNMATGNSATVYYNQQGGYVIIDDVTNAVVQVSDNINPSTWIPDPNIVNPYIPK